MKDRASHVGGLLLLLALQGAFWLAVGVWIGHCAAKPADAGVEEVIGESR